MGVTVGWRRGGKCWEEGLSANSQIIATDLRNYWLN